MAGQPRDDQRIEMRVGAPERGPAAARAVRELAGVDLDGPGPTGRGGARPWLRWVGAAVVVAAVGVAVVTWATAGDEQVLVTGPWDRLVPAPEVPGATPTLRWEVELPGSNLDGLVQVDGMVVAMTTTSEPASAEDQPSPHRSEVVAIDGLTGERAWTRVLDWTPRAPQPDPDEVFFGWGFDPPLVHVRGARQIVTLGTSGAGAPRLRQTLLDGATGEPVWTTGDPTDAPPPSDVGSFVARPGETTVTWTRNSPADESSDVVDLATGTTVLSIDGWVRPLPGTPLALSSSSEGVADERLVVLDEAGAPVLEMAVGGDAVVLGDVLVAVTDTGLLAVDDTGATMWEAALPSNSSGWWLLRQVDDRAGLVVHASNDVAREGPPAWAAMVHADGRVEELDPTTAFVAAAMEGAPVVAAPGSPRLLCGGLVEDRTCPAPTALVGLDGTVRASSDVALRGGGMETSWVGGGVATRRGVLGVDATGDLQGRLVLRSWRDLQPLWDADLDDATVAQELVLVPSAGGIAVSTAGDDFSPVTIAWYS